MFLGYISLPIFFISFVIGLLFMYILGPDIKKVYIYPSQENVDKILFRDKANNCFTFLEEEVDCPTNNNKLFYVPIQE